MGPCPAVRLVGLLLPGSFGPDPWALEAACRRCGWSSMLIKQANSELLLRVVTTINYDKIRQAYIIVVI